MLIKVKCFPSSKKEEIIKKNENTFLIKVKEDAKDGKANKRIFVILSDHFNTKNIKIIKGSKEPSKIYKIDE